MEKKTVILGLLGPSLDSGKVRSAGSVGGRQFRLCQHDDLLVDRFELLHEPKFKASVDRIRRTCDAVSPETTVRATRVDFDDPWDFEGVYGTLHDFAREYPFKPDEEEYLVHITTGSARRSDLLVPADRSAAICPPSCADRSAAGKIAAIAGSYAIIDLDLSKYDRLASRFNAECGRAPSFLKGGSTRATSSSTG